MRRRLSLAFLALLAVASSLVLAPAPPAAAQDQRDFTLVNASPRVISYVYVSASDVRDWQEDVLGTSVLGPGESVNIHFAPNDVDAGKCLYDIRVVGADGGEGILTGMNLGTTVRVGAAAGASVDVGGAAGTSVGGDRVGEGAGRRVGGSGDKVGTGCGG